MFSQVISTTAMVPSQEGKEQEPNHPQDSLWLGRGKCQQTSVGQLHSGWPSKDCVRGIICQVRGLKAGATVSTVCKHTWTVRARYVSPVSSCQVAGENATGWDLGRHSHASLSWLRFWHWHLCFDPWPARPCFCWSFLLWPWGCWVALHQSLSCQHVKSYHMPVIFFVSMTSWMSSHGIMWNHVKPWLSGF